MRNGDIVHPSSPLPESAIGSIPSRHTETRHATPGNTCTHFLNYRLTCDKYDEMRARAGGHCEICQTPEEDTPRGSLVIDHFQGEGLFFVRGLICDKCNSVMSRHDRTAAWGPTSLPFADRARQYHLNAFSRPTPEDFARADDIIARRKPFNVAARTPLPRGDKAKAIKVRLDQGMAHVARRLRRDLSAKQIARLIELLQE